MADGPYSISIAGLTWSVILSAMGMALSSLAVSRTYVRLTSGRLKPAILLKYFFYKSKILFRILIFTRPFSRFVL